jgi:hypothetical protein
MPLVILLLMLLNGRYVSAGQGSADCGEWRECQQRALEAAARREYEAFHDLAWRAVQKGPKQDAALMYVLARAQSLSGRPHDALVMLLRLAERGITTDAATNEEFAPVRRLPQWPDVEARLRGAVAVEAGGAPGAVTIAPPVTPESPRTDAATSATAAARAAGVTPGGSARAHDARRGPARDTARLADTGTVAPAPGAPLIEDALRVPSLAMTPVALAHDRASGRFVFGDATGRKLVIVDERMHFVVDLVREASAGFYDITAFEIDARRGDLWVVSAESATGATRLHHVQMVSGRPLARLEIPDGLTPGRFVDVAVTGDGIVYVLDAAGLRLLSMRQNARGLSVAARLDMRGPTSIAPAGEGVVYVAHEGGVSRVDTRSGRVSAVPGRETALPAFARLRWNAGALLGVERLADGTCRILRVRIDAATGRARQPQVLASGIAIPAPSAVAVSDDAVYFVSREETAGATGDTIVKRIPLGVRQN